MGALAKAPKCSKTVNAGDHRIANFRPCSGVAVKDGLCRRHLSLKARKEDKAAASRLVAKRSDEIEKEGRALAKRLGIVADVRYATNGPPSRWTYTPYLIVSFDDLKRLAGAPTDG